MVIRQLAGTSPGTPLLALSAVILDTEATGLNPLKDRVIQIGAVKGIKEKSKDLQSFESFIKTDMPISQGASNITGITSEDLMGAPDFVEIITPLNDFISNNIIIGHHIDFDIAILQQEYLRAQQHWPSLRSLDTGNLFRIVVQETPDYTLDTVMEFLNIDPEKFGKRHSALGDALMTREVFLKLIPLLRDKGIRTLAEAEAASKYLVDRFDQDRQKKSRSVVIDENELPINTAYARVDSFPYKHRVKEVMSSPIVVLASQDTLETALNTLFEEKISSVVVKLEDSASFGILTERDILRRFHNDPNTAPLAKLGDIASHPVQMISQDAFIYKAIGLMSRLNVRHLPIQSQTGEIIGMLTSRNLLGQRSGEAISLGDSIENADSIEELSRIWAELPLIARFLKDEGLEGYEVAAVISHELVALTRRAAQLAQQEMLDQGKGKPPLPFAVLVLGSGGRGESLLAMDQDNAIVYADGGNQEAADKWFAEFGEKMNDTLHAVGIPNCTGGIMAKNSEWRKSYSNWQKHVDSWIAQSNPDGVLNADIFFDGIPVYGNLDLGTSLLEYAHKQAHDSPQFQFFLAVNVQRLRSALGVFGTFRTVDDNRIDLKAGGLLPLLSGARILAIRHEHYHDHSTRARLEGVLSESDISKTDIEEIMLAHAFMLDLILRQQLFDISEGHPPSAKVMRSLLSKREKRKLHRALEKVSTIQHQVGGAYLPS